MEYMYGKFITSQGGYYLEIVLYFILHISSQSCDAVPEIDLELPMTMLLHKGLDR